MCRLHEPEESTEPVDLPECQRHCKDGPEAHHDELEGICVYDSDHAPHDGVDEQDRREPQHAPSRGDSEHRVGDEPARDDLRLDIDHRRHQDDRARKAPDALAVVPGLDESGNGQLLLPGEAWSQNRDHEPVRERDRKKHPSEGPACRVHHADGADERASRCVCGRHRRSAGEPAELPACDPVIPLVASRAQTVPANPEDDAEIADEDPHRGGHSRSTQIIHTAYATTTIPHATKSPQKVKPGPFTPLGS